ncbi:MAG: hypothetical protein HRT88_20370, partial [Lentisphaeraceae bacterium]|nr:hypothetical protein [Lentisphaeraceae bacterium]
MKKAILLTLISLLYVSCKNTDNIAADSLQTGELSPYVVPEKGVDKVISINQNWNWKTQQAFWFTGQGSKMIPYEWFLYLEQKDNENLFSDKNNMLKFGFIPQIKSLLNPDALPIGFAASTFDKKDKWLGLSCSACHTNQINYKGTAMLVDGAPALADISMFNTELAAAMQRTFDNDHKFSRFSRYILRENYSSKSAAALRKKLFEVTQVRLAYNSRNHSEVLGGSGRVDAFGYIFNQVAAGALKLPENIKEPNAPVSFPFLWGTPQSDVVQWVGRTPNGRLGSLARNAGEVLGVFGTVDIPQEGELGGYKSSIKIPELAELEEWVTNLRSPQWPEKHLPAIDLQKAAAGKVIYDSQCSACHQVIPRDKEYDSYKAKIIGLKAIKTDPKTAMNIATSKSKTGRLNGTVNRSKYASKEIAFFGETASTADVVRNAVVGAILNQPRQSLRAMLFGYHVKVDKPQNDPPLGYKARPLNGIWA